MNSREIIYKFLTSASGCGSNLFTEIQKDADRLIKKPVNLSATASELLDAPYSSGDKLISEGGALIQCIIQIASRNYTAKKLLDNKKLPDNYKIEKVLTDLYRKHVQPVILEMENSNFSKAKAKKILKLLEEIGRNTDIIDTTKKLKNLLQSLKTTLGDPTAGAGEESDDELTTAATAEDAEAKRRAALGFGEKKEPADLPPAPAPTTAEERPILKTISTLKEKLAEAEKKESEDNRSFKKAYQELMDVLKEGLEGRDITESEYSFNKKGIEDTYGVKYNLLKKDDVEEKDGAKSDPLKKDDVEEQHSSKKHSRQKSTFKEFLGKLTIKSTTSPTTTPTSSPTMTRPRSGHGSRAALSPTLTASESLTTSPSGSLASRPGSTSPTTSSPTPGSHRRGISSAAFALFSSSPTTKTKEQDEKAARTAEKRKELEERLRDHFGSSPEPKSPTSSPISVKKDAPDEDVSSMIDRLMRVV